MRKEEGSRNFLMCRGGRIMSHMNGSTNQRPYRHIMPISISGKDKLIDSESLGIRRGGELLLSEASNQNIMGTGYGVKSPSTDFLKKLDNLSVIGKSKRKNINIQL